MRVTAIVVAFCGIAAGSTPMFAQADVEESPRKALESVIDHRTCIEALHRLYGDQDLLQRDINIVGGSLNALGGKVDENALTPAKLGLAAVSKSLDQYIAGLSATCAALRPTE